ncbi:g383 [Coccomyxa elongata]
MVLLWQRALLIVGSIRACQHIPPDIQPHGSPAAPTMECAGRAAWPQRVRRWGGSHSTSGSPLLQCAWQPPLQQLQLGLLAAPHEAHPKLHAALLQGGLPAGHCRGRPGDSHQR